MATDTTHTVETCAAHWRMDTEDRCLECGHTKAEIDHAKNAKRRTEYVDGLRELADWLEQHPEVQQSPSGDRIYIFVSNKEELATVARALGRCEKYGDDTWFGVKRAFGPILLDACGTRENVCQRIVKGTREVTREVPDPDAPKVSVTETVEDVEWVCEPLLTVVDGGES